MPVAHGGAGYTFEACAILVVLPTGKKPSRAQLVVCARGVPVTAIRLPPGSTAFSSGAGQAVHEGVKKEMGNESGPGPARRERISVQSGLGSLR